MNIKKLARENGINHHTLRGRLKSGWTMEDALKTKTDRSVKKDCPVCGKNFSVSKSESHKYIACSSKCAGERRHGSDNPNFKDDWRFIRHRWEAMRDRCEKPHNISYKYYGARGIKLLVEREEYVEWYIANCNGDFSLTVDRIDPNGHYEFSNMQLIPLSENSAKANLGRSFPYNPAKEKRRIEIRISGQFFESLNAAIRAGYKSIKKHVKKGHLPDGTPIEVLETYTDTNNIFRSE